MIMGLGCACQEQSGTGIRGLGDACGDQPPAASPSYPDWYNCWNAEQANPTPPITSWIAFNPQGQPVTVIPKTISTPTVVVPYTAPLPTNQPVVAPYPPSIPVSANGTPLPIPILTGTAIVNNTPPVVLPAPVLVGNPTPITNLPNIFVDGQNPVSSISTPVIGISATTPLVDTTVTTDYTPYLIAGGLGLLGLLFLT